MKFEHIHPKPNWQCLTDCIPVEDKMIISCCDCGLAHEFWFRKIKGRLMWRAKRHNGATKENRKINKYEK